jgi:hypothetical protein
MRWTGGDFRVIIYKNGQLNKKRHIGCAKYASYFGNHNGLLVLLVQDSTVQTFPIQRNYK